MATRTTIFAVVISLAAYWWSGFVTPCGGVSSCGPYNLYADLPSTARFTFPISSTQLEGLLKKCQLTWPASTNELLHFWRLWNGNREHSGNGEFPIRGEYVSCAQVKQIFLDDNYFRQVYPNQSWYKKGPIGPYVATQHTDDPGSVGEAHPADYLCTLAECGVATNEPIAIFNHSYSVADFVAQTMSNYVVGEPAEFAAPAFAIYLSPNDSFQNRFGDQVTMSDLMDTLTHSEPGAGSCYGTHVCFAIASLLRVDTASHVLSSAARRNGTDYLAKVGVMLKSSQHPDGAWRMDWTSSAPASAPAVARSTWGDAIVMTGHHLEWLAIAPQHVDDAHCEAAIMFLVKSLHEVPEEDIRSSYLAWSHAAHSLVLWQQKCTTDPVNL